MKKIMIVKNEQRKVKEDCMKIDKPLSKREIKKAAQLFVLISMAYGVDNDGCDGNTDREAMIEEVVRNAKETLQKEFSDLESLPVTQAECVDAIKGMRK